jgi:hypothetical protein
MINIGCISRRFLVVSCLLAAKLCIAQSPASPTKTVPNVPGFTQPAPMEFNDHEGYVPLFNGKDLKDWDGDPKFWRVENEAIVGESTEKNPSGNSYIVYRGMKAKDFTLKFEIKVEGDGGSGIQYRSKTGIPWRSPIPANLGPVNLNWMMTGPQADFWPSAQYWTGQFYSENTPMRILAWRGQVVEGYGNKAPDGQYWRYYGSGQICKKGRLEPVYGNCQGRGIYPHY